MKTVQEEIWIHIPGVKHRIIDARVLNQISNQVYGQVPVNQMKNTILHQLKKAILLLYGRINNDKHQTE